MITTTKPAKMPLTEISQLSLSNKENATDQQVGKAVQSGPVKPVAVSDLKRLESEEPLLKENPKRFVILPIEVSSNQKRNKLTGLD